MIELILIGLLSWFIYEHVPYGKPIVGAIAVVLLLKLLGIIQYPIILI